MKKVGSVYRVLVLLLVLALMSSLVGVALPAAVSADDEWSTPLNISNSAGAAVDPDIAVDGAGNVHVVWADHTPGNYDVFYRSFDGVSWSDPLNISINPGDSNIPAIAVGSHIHVVWTDITPGHFDILYSTSADGVSWSDPLNISNTTDMSYDPKIALDGDGNPHVVWIDGGDEHRWWDYDIFYSTYDGVSWSDPVNISNTTGGSFDPDIAVGSSMHVVWRDDTVFPQVVYAASADGITWSDPVAVCWCFDGPYGARIAVGSDIHVVWEDAFTGPYDIFYASSADGEKWPGPVVDISYNSGTSAAPDIALDGDGNLHLLWEDDTGGDCDILYATSADGVSWSDPVNISNTPGNSTAPAIATGSDLHAVWDDDTPGNDDIFYATKAAPPAGLSGGAIAGIVIGSLVGAVAIFLAVRKWVWPAPT